MRKGQVLKSPGGCIYVVVADSPRIRVREEKSGVVSFVCPDLLKRMKSIGR